MVYSDSKIISKGPPPVIQSGDLWFNVVVKNGGTTDSPGTFLAVKSQYYPVWVSDVPSCKIGPKYFQIPALKPGKSWIYGSRIEDLGAGPGYCKCKDGDCSVGWIRFTLHKLVYQPQAKAGAQMTGPNTSLETSWNNIYDWNIEVKDLSQ
jgi:hypothetical protein